MEPLIVYTNASLVEQGGEEKFYLDMDMQTFEAYDGQEDGNSFSLQLPENVMLSKKCLVHVDGTGLGGFVQRRVSDTAVDDLLQWEGRTFQGFMQDRVLVPDAGQDYNTASGTDAQCISDLLTRLGLTGMYSVGTTTGTAISYQYERYPDGWTALQKMLASVGLVPTFEVVHSGGAVKVSVGSKAARTLDEVADGELADVEITADFMPYNHIIARGKGDLHDQDIVHRYADANGNISTTQTFTGDLERVYRYDSFSADHDDLIEGAEEKLADLQGQGEVEVTLDPDADVSLGDYVTAYDQRIGATVTAKVTGCVVKIENGTMTCAFSAGE